MPADAGTASSGAFTEKAPEGPSRYSVTLQIKRYGPEPLYFQLAQSVEQAVEAGAIRSGTKLPSIQALARELNLASSTIRSAWAYLERRGILTCKGQKGTTVL